MWSLHEAMLAFTSEYKLHVMGNHDVETIQQYIKYIVFSMAKFKSGYDLVTRDNPSLVVANQLKTDLRIMFDTGTVIDL